MSEDYTPRVWIGCLACYNDGRLVGEWFDAIIAGDITLDEVHANAGGTRVGCEELWVMDTDNMPQAREMSPSEAQEIAETVDSIDEDKRLRLAFAAYLRHYGVTEIDHHAVSGFEDSYAGEWGSFREFSDEQAAEFWPELNDGEGLAGYFDWDKYASEQEMYHGTESAPGGNVYVFRAV